MKKQTGFTIVELLIVIVVIGILAAITIVAFNGVKDRATYSSAHASLRSLKTALQSYHAIHGAYPSTGASSTPTSPVWRYSCATGIDNFMVGVTTVSSSLPQAPCKDPAGTNTNDTWLYSSDGQGYKLIYIRPIMSDNAKNNFPDSMKDPRRSPPTTSITTAWGYWTDEWRNT